MDKTAEEIRRNHQLLLDIKLICNNFARNPDNVEDLTKLKVLLDKSSSTFIQAVEPFIFAAFYPAFNKIAQSKLNNEIPIKVRNALVDTLTSLFNKITIDKEPLFFNIYGFLLHEIYDLQNHRIYDLSEEYKLSIMQCMTSLAKSVSRDLVSTIYVKKNSPKFSQMLSVALQLAKKEQYKKLRIAAIECIMSIARVLEDIDFEEVVIRDQIAEVFMFIIPGIASQLKDICLEDEKVGHKIPAIALKAWARIVTLQMQDYNAFDNRINITNTKKHSYTKKSKKWNNEKELDKYLEEASRTPEWYKETDQNLHRIIVEFTKLTHHFHEKVRLELANLAELLIQNCSNTMPLSLSQIIEITILLSQDSDNVVATKCRGILENLTNKFNDVQFKNLMDNLEEGFYNTIMATPRKFNSVDEGEQLSALNLLLGYINIFNKHKLLTVLHSKIHLEKLMTTLVHISQFDKSHISLSEDFNTQDFKPQPKTEMSWKIFHHFKEDFLWKKLEKICCALGKYGASHIISDFLLDVFQNNRDQRTEAIFLLNGLISGMTAKDLPIIRNILNVYTDPTNWYLPLCVMIDDEGYEHTFGDIQNYILQICLLVEGVGIVALSLQKDFKPFLITNLYLVIERAGSNHPLIRSAGMLALENISKACDYHDVQDLINNNLDYFSFNLSRRLRKSIITTSVLNVLQAILQYNSIYVQNCTLELIKDLLGQTDKDLSSVVHLLLFRTFLISIHQWLNIKVEPKPFKTKKEKLEEIEDFKVTGIQENQGFTDDIMGKSAEEMWKEDMEKKQKDLEEELISSEEPYKKPKPPTPIELTVQILKEILHVLASKDQDKQLLVLQILKHGVEILKDWEDELLPIVHLIWSPLCPRFQERNYLIINHSFKLLIVLAQLSGSFIRSRVTKEVIPHIESLLLKLSKESYLKDKGSAYRYTQAYKLQLELLVNLAKLIIDLEMLDEPAKNLLNVVFPYLSDKQPIPLQTAAVEFYRLLHTYDPSLLKELLSKNVDNNEYMKNMNVLKNF